jgi:putative FmdB family regulatory protein
MEIYEYMCTKCGSHFEKLQNDSVAQPENCPSCGSSEVKRELSIFSSAAAAPSAMGCFSGGG